MIKRYANLQWAIYGQVATGIANLLTSVLIVQSAGLEKFGQFSFCFLLLMVSKNFLTGLVFVPLEAVHAKINKRSHTIYRGFLILNVLLYAAISTSLLATLTIPLGLLVAIPELGKLTTLLCLSCIATIGSDFFVRYHHVYRKGAIGFSLELLRYLIQLSTLGIALSFDWGVKEHGPSIGLISIIAGGLSASIGGFLVFGTMRFHNKLYAALWARHWNFVKWMTPMVVLQTTQGLAPMFIGCALLGDATFGAARAIQQLTNVLNIPLNGMNQVVPAFAAKFFAAGGIKAMREYLLQVFGACFLMAVLFSIALLLFSSSILRIFLDSVSTENYWLLVLFCVLNIVNTIRMPFQIVSHTIESPEITTVANLIGTLLVISLSYFAFLFFGVLAFPTIFILFACLTTVIVCILLRKKCDPNQNSTFSNFSCHQ